MGAAVRHPGRLQWITRSVVADIVTSTICGLELQYPEVTDEHKKLLEVPRKKLANEK